MGHARLWLCGVGFWGWFLYLLGSAGYFAIDSMAALNLSLPESTWDLVYTVLAAVFLLDAIVYGIEWALDSAAPRRLDTGFWANATNVTASLFLVVSAGIFLVYPRVGAAGDFEKERVIVQSALNLSAVLLYALDALLYASEYYNARLELSNAERADRPVLREPHFYSELLNAVSSLGYLATGVVQIFSILNIADLGRATHVIHRFFLIFFQRGFGGCRRRCRWRIWCLI
jgi:hypothetical protein